MGKESNKRGISWFHVNVVTNCTSQTGTPPIEKNAEALLIFSFEQKQKGIKIAISEEKLPNPRHYPLYATLEPWAMSSLVVRASDSKPVGLGSMPDAPPNTLRVHTEYVLIKSMGLKVLWAESRVQGTGEYFPPLQFHA
ncbi:uncharacterized protein TNCV_4032591 [Trichonephila clavipes]|nr:uncharacterized protein TNCV_4032591 [Trichonephila clavipes]